MTPDQFSPAFRRIHMELAREPGHPEGDPSDSYVLVAPLLEDGRIDAASWKEHRTACRVVHRHGGDTDIGHLVHGPGGQWRIHYDIAGDAEDEVGYRLASEKLVAGEYVSIIRDNDAHPYRVTAVTPLD